MNTLTEEFDRMVKEYQATIWLLLDAEPLARQTALQLLTDTDLQVILNRLRRLPVQTASLLSQAEAELGRREVIEPQFEVRNNSGSEGGWREEDGA